MQRRHVVLAGAAAAAVGLAAAARMREPMLTWGASADEASGSMPGDDLVPDADLVATRAITIDAPPPAVWPWLVQIGIGRGGAYSYDWLEHLAGNPGDSAETVVPELQDLAVGDVIPFSGDGTGLRVVTLEPDELLALRNDEGTWSWTWLLRPDGETTRFLSRTRMRSTSRANRAAIETVMLPASWVMERKMLHGLRRRAESTTGD